MSNLILNKINELIYMFMQSEDCDDELFNSWKDKKYQDKLLELLKTPKRAKSAYIFFCQENRSYIKENNPELKSTEITKKLAELWKELKEDEDRVEEYEKYLELAKKEKEKLGIPIKEKVQKRAKSAYTFFCQANRQDIKDDYPNLKSSEITKMLSEMWKELKNDSERSDELADYENMAAKDKEKFGKSEKLEKSTKKKTAYMVFCEMNRPDLKEENPEMSGKEINSNLSYMWKQLKEDINRKSELEEYEKLAKNYKEEDKPKKVSKSNRKVKSKIKPKEKEVEESVEKQIDELVEKEEEKPVEIFVKKQVKTNVNNISTSNIKMYNNFRNKHMNIIKEQNPEMSKIQIDKEIRNIWIKMSEEEKMEYN